MKTIKYICTICLTILFFSCGKSVKDVVATQWTMTNGTGIPMSSATGRTAEKYFKNTEAYIAFQEKVIEILKNRVFDLKEDGSFSMTSLGNDEVKGTWEYSLGSEFEIIEFTVNGKMFESWKADLNGGSSGFKRLSNNNSQYVTALYTNEEFKEIIGKSTFEVELAIVPKNTEGFSHEPLN